MSVDTKSKERVAQLMSLSSWFDSDNISPFETWDLSTDYKGIKLGIEVKNRETYTSTGFLAGINSAQEDKVTNNRNLISQGVFDVVLLISLYTDDVMRVSNITSDYEVDMRNSKISTYWNPEYKNKTYANFKKYVEYKIINNKLKRR